MSDTESLVTDIRKELRSAMNGAASAAMRRAGSPYRLVYGVELPRLKDIASRFRPGSALAERLWAEDTRETKILACLLMPPAELTPALAGEWADQAPCAEASQMLAALLLSRAPGAAALAAEWTASTSGGRRLCGFLCLARQLRGGIVLSAREREALESRARAQLHGAGLHMAKAIAACLAALEDSEASPKSGRG